MSGHRESHRKQTLTFEGTGTAAAAFQEAALLGWSGRLVRCVTRMDAGGGATACTIRVANGAYTTATTPAAVPDEDLAYREAGVSLSGHATTADQDTNIVSTSGGAHYVARQDADFLLVSVEVTAGAGAWTINITLYADEVE